MRKHWKLIVVAAVVMLTPIVIWVATMHLGRQNDVEAYRKLLIAKGEKLDISELPQPSMSPEQNGADIVKQASAMLMVVPGTVAYSIDPQAMRMIAPGKAMVCFEQPDVRSERFTNSWASVMDAAEADRPATELARQVINFPSIDFGLDLKSYDNGSEAGRIYSSLFRLSARLSAEAICSLHRGDTAMAATNVYVLLALAYEEQQGRIPIICRLMQANTAVKSSWELLQSTNLDDAELAMLQAGWERLEFIHATENWVSIDRAVNESEIQKMRISNADFNRFMRGGPASAGGDVWANVKQTAVRAAWQESWSYSDELQMLKNDQIVLEAIRTVETNGYFEPTYTNMVNDLYSGTTNESENFLTMLDEGDFRERFSQESKHMGNLFGSTMRIETAREMVIAAIALKRYRLKHGDYPAMLSGLTPEFLPSVPLDPMDGKPLRYRRNADGTYLLYSVGVNGVDDGGDASLSPGASIRYSYYWLDLGGLDWVWPQAATKAEVVYYYEHLARP